MTPNAQHKRAERERRVARGDKRIEVWVSRRTQEGIADILDNSGGDLLSVEEAIAHAVHFGRKYA